MVVLDHLGSRVGRARRDVRGAEGLADLESGLVGRPSLYRRPDDVLGVGAPAGPCGEPLVGEPTGLADQFRECLELVLAGHLHHEPAVGRAEGPDHDHRHAFALAERPEVGDDVTHGQHRVEHRDVDQLSAAGPVALAQRRLHPDHREQRRGDVTQGSGRDDPRWFVAEAGVVVEARHRLGDHRIGGPRPVRRVPEVSEARHRNADELGPTFRQHVVAESESVHGAGLEVLPDDVEAAGQFDEQFAPARVLQVESDRALVEVVA